MASKCGGKGVMSNNKAMPKHNKTKGGTKGPGNGPKKGK